MKRFFAPVSFITLFLTAGLLSGCTTMIRLAVDWNQHTQASYYRDEIPSGGWVDPDWTGVPRSVSILYAEPMFDGYASLKREWPEYGSNFSNWFKQKMEYAARTLTAHAEVECVYDSAFVKEQRSVLWFDRKYSTVETIDVPTLHKKYWDSVNEVAVVISPIVIVAEDYNDSLSAKTVKALYSIVDIKRDKILAYGKAEASGYLDRDARASLSEILLRKVVKDTPLEQISLSPLD